MKKPTKEYMVASVKQLHRCIVIFKAFWILAFLFVICVQAPVVLAGKWKHEFFAVLFLGCFAVILCYCLSAIFLQYILNLRLYECMYYGYTIEDAELCQAVRSQVKLMFLFHRQFFRWHRTTPSEVLGKVLRA